MVAKERVWVCFIHSLTSCSCLTCVINSCFSFSKFSTFPFNLCTSFFSSFSWLCCSGVGFAWRASSNSFLYFSSSSSSFCMESFFSCLSFFSWLNWFSACVNFLLSVWILEWGVWVVSVSWEMCTLHTISNLLDSSTSCFSSVSF